MIRAILFALLLLPFAAGAAAPVCWPNLTLPVTVQMKAARTTPVALGEVIYSASTVGLVWGYACKDGSGQWYKVIAAGAWDTMPREWLSIADTALRGTDADRKALWEKYATASEWDARLKSDLDAVWALIPGPPPAPPAVVWKVVPDQFRADKKRLVYTVVSGKRGGVTSPIQYVDAGAPCDPVVTITEFGPTYYLSVLGDPNKVARCAKQ